MAAGLPNANQMTVLLMSVIKELMVATGMMFVTMATQMKHVSAQIQNFYAKTLLDRGVLLSLAVALTLRVVLLRHQPPPAAGVVQIQKTARVPGRHLDHIRAKSPAKPTVILLQPRHPHRHQ